MLRAYSIFDDFPESAIRPLQEKGIEVSLLLKGQERPSGKDLKRLLDTYDILFISTAQKMPEDMFSDVASPKIIATASSGIDHIRVPEAKQGLVRLARAGTANRTTVAEHILALILSLEKNLEEGRTVASKGLGKKKMSSQPHDLRDATIGVVGAGGIATTLLSYARTFGMKRLCWTFHPERHTDLTDNGVVFTGLDTLLSCSDIVVVSLPFSEKTDGLISADRIGRMKEDAVFISTSRAGIIDHAALFQRARRSPAFRIGLDIDADLVADLWEADMPNVIVTPHIAGGTVESRIRLFEECSANVIQSLTEEH